MSDWTATRRTSPVGLAPRPRGLASRALGKGSLLWQMDWVLTVAVLALSGLGALLVWSATRQRMLDAGGDPQAFLKRHVINVGLGLVLAVVSALIDYRLLRAYAPVVYVASLLGLVAVLSPLGSTHNGAHSWIDLPGGFQVQPSEFAKVALVVGMAMLLGEKRDREDNPRDVDIVLVLVLAAVPMGLIMLQPDFGSTMVFVFAILGMLAVSGAPTRWLVGLALAGVLAGWAGLHFGVLSHYQTARLTAFADPHADPTGIGYNTQQARIAIGSGGVLGKGLFHGTQSEGGFIPEQQTDFIFTVAGEELGFVGSGAIIALMGLVLWRGLRIAAAAGDAFGRILAAGVVTWFAFQSFENIGMTLGIMPVTGLPLPFVSYGGSSMFAAMMAVGLLQNVHLRSTD